MLGTIRRTLAREDGASAVEYGLLIAAIAAIIVGVVFLLGSRVRSTFSKTNSCIGASSTAC
jgi:pilus assembly protein Flp/PilA